MGNILVIGVPLCLIDFPPRKVLGRGCNGDTSMAGKVVELIFFFFVCCIFFLGLPGLFWGLRHFCRSVSGKVPIYISIAGIFPSFLKPKRGPECWKGWKFAAEWSIRWSPVHYINTFFLCGELLFCFVCRWQTACSFACASLVLKDSDYSTHLLEVQWCSALCW